jgi:hypothetical protein
LTGEKNQKVRILYEGDFLLIWQIARVYADLKTRWGILGEEGCYFWG